MFLVQSKKNGEIFTSEKAETIEEARLIAQKELSRLKFSDSTPSKKNPYLRDRQEIDEMITDLSLDKEYLEKEAMQKRESEYPSMKEFFLAYILDRKGDDSKMIELINKVDLVDTKYPLPEKIKGI